MPLDTGSKGCEFDSRWDHCFNLLKALGKLLSTNVHLLDPGVDGYLAQDSFNSAAPGIIVVAAMGVFAPQGIEMAKREHQVRYKGLGGGVKLVKSCECILRDTTLFQSMNLGTKSKHPLEVESFIDF